MHARRRVQELVAAIKMEVGYYLDPSTEPKVNHGGPLGQSAAERARAQHGHALSGHARWWQAAAPRASWKAEAASLAQASAGSSLAR